MQQDQGISAPDTVEEGSTSPITVEAPGSKTIIIDVSTTGDLIYVNVNTEGKAIFELPSSALAGAILTVVDSDDSSKSTTIAVVPSSL